MHYVKEFNINGITTRQAACIELRGKPNAATEGYVGVLGMDVTSPTREVYKCTEVRGSIYTWELLSSGGGASGKTAYEYARDGGYTGTETQFGELLANAVDKRNITLGLNTDGLVYVFVDGVPVGNGIALPSKAGDVVGNVDIGNNIVLIGDLADGTYTVKYEMEDGSTVNIGNLVLDTNVYYSITNNLTNCVSSNGSTSVAQGNSYSATITANDGYELKSVSVTMGGTAVSVSSGTINIASVTGDIVITAVAEAVSTNALHKAINADGTPYIGTNGEKGYKTGVRISGTSGDETTQAGCMATGFIEAQSGQIVVIENMTLHSTTSYNVLVLYDETFTKTINTQIVAGNSGISNPSSGVYEIRISAFANAAKVRYIRFSCADLTNTVITYRNG